MTLGCETCSLAPFNNIPNFEPLSPNAKSLRVNRILLLCASKVEAPLSHFPHQAPLLKKESAEFAASRSRKIPISAPQIRYFSVTPSCPKALSFDEHPQLDTYHNNDHVGQPGPKEEPVECAVLEESFQKYLRPFEATRKEIALKAPMTSDQVATWSVTHPLLFDVFGLLSAINASNGAHRWSKHVLTLSCRFQNKRARTRGRGTALGKAQKPRGRAHIGSW
mgnify:CR=1 FL=1